MGIAAVGEIAACERALRLLARRPRTSPGALDDPALELLFRDVEAEDQGRMPRLAVQSRSRWAVGCPASSSARTTRRRSFGWTAAAARVELGEMRVRPLGALLVVDSPSALARRRSRCGRQRELGERSAQVEPGAADDDRRPAGGEDLVDRRVREPLVLGDRAFVIERPDRRPAGPETGL